MILTPFLTEKEAYTHSAAIVDNSWDYIKDLLMEYQNANTKEEIQMFNLWSMKTENFEEPRNKETGEIYKPGFIARCSDNCVGLWGLVLDYDKNLTIVDAIDLFDGFEYVLYTTWNHRRFDEIKNVMRGDRFRVVIPFTRMMTMDEYNEKLDNIKDTFPGVDNASFTRSQAMFHHSGIKEEALSFHRSGDFIDPGMFLNKPKVKPKSTKPSKITKFTDLQRSQWTTQVLNALSLCTNIRRGNGMVLAAIVKGCDGTFEDFKSICELMVDSSLSNGKAYGPVWSDAKQDIHVSKNTINKYLQNWGGKIIPQSITEKGRELNNRIKELQNGK